MSETETKTQEQPNTSNSEPSTPKPAETKSEWVEAVKQLKAERQSDKKERDESKRRLTGEHPTDEEDASQDNVVKAEGDEGEGEAETSAEPEPEASKTDQKKKDDKYLKRAEQIAKRERDLIVQQKQVQEDRSKLARWADLVKEAQEIKHNVKADPLKFLESQGVTPIALYDRLFELYGNQIVEGQLTKEDPDDPKVQIRELKKQLEALRSNDENGQKEKKRLEDERLQAQQLEELNRIREHELNVISQWCNDPKTYPFLVSYGQDGFVQLQDAVYEYQKLNQLKEVSYDQVLLVAQSLERIFKERDEKELERIHRARGTSLASDSPQKGKGRQPSVEGSDDAPRGETLGQSAAPKHNKKAFDKEKWAERWASKL
jgi:hypothetical protein